MPMVLTIAAAALPTSAAEAPPTLAYATSGSCLNSPMGFSAKLEPGNAGVAWAMSFNAIGTADADGNVTEVGRSVDTASFGAGPRMHAPGANAYRVTFTATAKENSDGSYTVVTGTLRGTFTEGPYAGQSFTASPGLTFKRWAGRNGASVEVTTGPPVVQTLSLANGVSFARICTATTMITSLAH
jgi:hypothetical protein